MGQDGSSWKRDNPKAANAYHLLTNRLVPKKFDLEVQIRRLKIVLEDISSWSTWSLSQPVALTCR